MKSLLLNSRTMKTVAAVALLAGAALGAQAQELKIGYVNSDRVLRDATPAKAAQAKLEAEFSKRQKEGDGEAAKPVLIHRGGSVAQGCGPGKRFGCPRSSD